eukprot:scaffold31826_cov56-Phaeocystis_antarctica.AAC.1
MRVVFEIKRPRPGPDCRHETKGSHKPREPRASCRAPPSPLTALGRAANIQRNTAAHCSNTVKVG